MKEITKEKIEKILQKCRENANTITLDDVSDLFYAMEIIGDGEIVPGCTDEMYEEILDVLYGEQNVRDIIQDLNAIIPKYLVEKDGKRYLSSDNGGYIALWLTPLEKYLEGKTGIDLSVVDGIEGDVETVDIHCISKWPKKMNGTVRLEECDVLENYSFDGLEELGGIESYCETIKNVRFPSKVSYINMQDVETAEYVWLPNYVNDCNSNIFVNMTTAGNIHYGDGKSINYSIDVMEVDNYTGPIYCPEIVKGNMYWSSDISQIHMPKKLLGQADTTKVQFNGEVLPEYIDDIMLFDDNATLPKMVRILHVILWYFDKNISDIKLPVAEEYLEIQGNFSKSFDGFVLPNCPQIDLRDVDLTGLIIPENFEGEANCYNVRINGESYPQIEGVEKLRELCKPKHY